MKDFKVKPLLIISLVILLCFAFGCQDKEALAELEEFEAQAEVAEQNKAAVRRMFDEMNKGNVEILEEVLAPDYVFYTPSGNPNPMSREVTIEIIKTVFKTFPDMNWSIEELIAVEDRVIGRFIDRGIHKGEYQGIPATGNKIEVSAVHIFRLKNGKIVEHFEEADMLGLMQQLGMELKPQEKE